MGRGLAPLSQQRTPLPWTPLAKLPCSSTGAEAGRSQSYAGGVLCQLGHGTLPPVLRAAASSTNGLRESELPQAAGRRAGHAPWGAWPARAGLERGSLGKRGRPGLHPSNQPPP